jgi:CRISPR-associated protein Csb2
MSKSKNSTGQVNLCFSGRQPADPSQPVAAGSPAEGHPHAWYLPEMNPQGRIDYVVVFTASGFSESAIAALGNLKRVWGREGFDVQTVLVTLGHTDHYSFDQLQPGCSPLIRKSRRWQTLTPMVLPRHPKVDRRGHPKLLPDTCFQIDGPEHQTLRLLRQLLHQVHGDRSLENSIAVQSVGDDGECWLGYQCQEGQLLVKTRRFSQNEANQLSRYPWHAFQRRRYHGNGSKASDRAYWLKIEFDKPQAGPIALGYAAHFGLGVFVPI